MTTSSTRRLQSAWLLLAALTALAPSVALAAGKAATVDPKARYQRESAACGSIKFFDDRMVCLSEASTRYAGTQPSRADEAPDILARNALRRCEALPEPDRKDCVARMQGQGTTTGSVDAGGIYRELVTREVIEVTPSPTQPASDAAVPAK